MTVLGTDIEQGIREAIAETLGDMRYEMWFGDNARVDILADGIRVHAVNVFAADWVEKNYRATILKACHDFVERNQRLEIVSTGQANQFVSEMKNPVDADDAMLIEKKNNKSEKNFATPKQDDSILCEIPVTKPRWNAEMLISPRRKNAQKSTPTKGTLVCSFLEDSAIVRSDAPCEKEVVLSIPASKVKAKPRRKTVSPVDAEPLRADDKRESNVASKPQNRSQPNRRNCVAASKIAHMKLTSQELNEQIAAPDKKKPAAMPLGTPRQPVDPRAAAAKAAEARTPAARRTDKVAKPGGAGSDSTKPGKAASEPSIPALKRDAANRNVVVVSGSSKKQAKPTGNAVMTLERFVVGPSNRLAVRAAELAINHAGQISPIYIFGPTSVGKTHLLETVKAGLRRDRQARPPIMMTAEQFTSSFIDGLKQGIPLFRNKFRGISALLIDDIQFFAGKDSTQTEFLRTIELLKGQGVQVVLTGDRPLNALADLLKPEIVSRLEAGMQCEIKPAESEMLLAIFKQMAASRKLKLSDEVCDYVVSRLATHARQLSGAVNRLHAAVLTSRRPITLDSVENLLEDMIRNNRRAVRLQDIDKAVCETLQLSGQLLQSKSRAKPATQPRMLAMWLARKYTRSALSEIGRYFGGRSHSTVVSAQKKVDQWLREASDFGLTDAAIPITEVIQKVERLLQTR